MLLAALRHLMSTVFYRDNFQWYLPDDTIRPLAELFRYVVALIDDEVLVEDLECSPPCEIRHLASLDQQGVYK